MTEYLLRHDQRLTRTSQGPVDTKIEFYELSGKIEPGTGWYKFFRRLKPYRHQMIKPGDILVIPNAGCDSVKVITYIAITDSDLTESRRVEYVTRYCNDVDGKLSNSFQKHRAKKINHPRIKEWPTVTTPDNHFYYSGVFLDESINPAMYNETIDADLATSWFFVSAGTQLKGEYSALDNAMATDCPFNGKVFLVPHENGPAHKKGPKWLDPEYLAERFECSLQDGRNLADQLKPLELDRKAAYALINGAVSKGSTAKATTAYLTNLNAELSTVNDYTKQDHVDWWRDVFAKATPETRYSEHLSGFRAEVFGRRDHRTQIANRLDDKIERDNAIMSHIEEQYNTFIEYSDEAEDLDFFDFEAAYNAIPSTGDNAIGYHPVYDGTEALPFEITTWLRFATTEDLDIAVKQQAKAHWWTPGQRSMFWTYYNARFAHFAKLAKSENDSYFMDVANRILNLKTKAELKTAAAYLRVYENGGTWDTNGKKHQAKAPTSTGAWYLWKLYNRTKRSVDPDAWRKNKAA